MFEEAQSNFPFKLSYLTLAGIIGAFVGTILGVAGAVNLVWTRSTPIDQEPQGITQQPTAPATDPTVIVVYISGAVENPGVYTLEPGSRLSRLVEEAGGFSSAADSYFIAKDLNLAQSLSDGMKIYIPSKGEQSLALTTISSDGKKVGLLSINEASQQELESLTGVGPKRAQDIIAGRPYLSIQDLVDNQVIPQSIFDNIFQEIEL